MKKLFNIITAALLVCAMLLGCTAKNDAPSGTQPPEALNTSTPEVTAAPDRAVTEAMAYEGVGIYCQLEYGLERIGDDSYGSYLLMTDVTEAEYELTFRTYTGVTVHFHIDRSSGRTRIVEFVPALDREVEAGSFDLFDYLEREVPTSAPVEETPAPVEETPAPAETPVPQPKGQYVFKPKVCSVYLEEVFGETMCETWFNLVDAVMAGEDTFACPDKHTYDWVMGQFPRLCFPVLLEIVDFAYDRSNPVVDGVGSFTWLVPKEEAASMIAEFAEQIEGILNEVLEDDWSDVEKALALYIYFSRTYEYDWDTYYQDLEAQVDYTTTYRLFKTGMGICREIAPAYSYLLMQAGVEATTVMGSNHEWSYVRMGGRNYHIDPTFVLSEMDSLAYFMMTDDQRDATGCSKDQFTYTSNYSQDHPHPDYVADDDYFAPVWEYRIRSFSHDEKVINAWYYTEGWQEEDFYFDYSGFDRP